MNSRERDARPRSDTEIGSLLREAGPRPEPTTEEMAVMRASARTAWEDLVESRQRSWFRAPMPRALAMAAALALAVVTIWYVQRQNATVEAQVAATIEVASGETRIGAASARVGSDLLTDAEITVELEPAGGASLRVVGGQSLRLDSGTRMRFLSPTTIELSRGAIYVDSPASVLEEATLSVKTPFGLIEEVGTQYEVRLNGSVEVRVREGAITITRDGETYSAEGGESVEVYSDGSVDRSSVDPRGGSWDWTLDLAPALDIEGRTLASFLEWVARETAWEITFETEELEASADEIQLHGSIDNLRPDEAVTVILRGSGLDSRLLDGELLILRP